MRFSDSLLNSVGFVVDVVQLADGSQDHDPIGTGFFVRVASEAVPNLWYHYFLTARHVVEESEGRSVGILVNGHDGQSSLIRPPDPHWVFHPDSTVDATAASLNYYGSPGGQAVLIPTTMFLTAEAIIRESIGVGDEIYMPGLFTYAHGLGRNIPVVRHGTIAMMPPSAIQVGSGFAEVYLIEARSIGGISGSPVYVRRTLEVAVQHPSGGPDSLSGPGGKFFLLGLVHGHWDIRESEVNSPRLVHDPKRGVNMGIGVVVPAPKLLELLYLPEFADARRTFEARDQWCQDQIALDGRGSRTEA